MKLSKTVFVSDLDGTLLTTDKRVTPADIAALRRFTDLGGHFVIATGRPIQTTERYLDTLQSDLPLILYNGCIIYDHRKYEILYSDYLPEIAKEILVDVRERFPNISPEIFTFEGQYYFIMNDAERWHHEILGIDYDKLESHLEIKEPWCKMLFADDPDVITELEEYIKKFDNMGVRFVRSCPKFLEVLPVNASKGTAMLKLKELCGLSDCTFAASGDYDNDLEMLEAADISFCPANSQECVKSAVDYVLKSTCDDGATAEALNILEHRIIGEDG